MGGVDGSLTELFQLKISEVAAELGLGLTEEQLMSLAMQAATIIDPDHLLNLHYRQHEARWLLEECRDVLTVFHLYKKGLPGVHDLSQVLHQHGNQSLTLGAVMTASDLYCKLTQKGY